MNTPPPPTDDDPQAQFRADIKALIKVAGTSVQAIPYRTINRLKLEEAIRQAARWFPEES